MRRKNPDDALDSQAPLRWEDFFLQAGPAARDGILDLSLLINNAFPSLSAVEEPAAAALIQFFEEVIAARAATTGPAAIDDIDSLLNGGHGLMNVLMPPSPQWDRSHPLAWEQADVSDGNRMFDYMAPWIEKFEQDAAAYAERTDLFLIDPPAAPTDLSDPFLI